MLELLNHSDFDKLFHLIEESFPSDEYRIYEEQKELLKNPLYSVYTVYSETRSIKGFISVWEFENLAYVEHFAVNPNYRNAGLGKSMLQELRQHLNKMICLEVEPPEDEMSIRRIKFYERNDFFLNEYPYMQPAMSKGKHPIPLLIMTSGAKIEEPIFEEIKNTLYKIVYKC